ncbi:hypothetical protein A4H97_32760 [Niastella yeongjuensis]|uniref:Uncharacterized protein n=1 Tax=Niastella yeongjuensis TaxID=354355 RepID=A0A1V9EGM3_9BACT|nr:hypothetical protein A4H97_32760 [Niastella yeongjuensis]
MSIKKPVVLVALPVESCSSFPPGADKFCDETKFMIHKMFKCIKNLPDFFGCLRALSKNSYRS